VARRWPSTSIADELGVHAGTVGDRLDQDGLARQRATAGLAGQSSGIACAHRTAGGSAWLKRQMNQLALSGAPELFADLFQPTGRRSVPPSILAVVMVLQRLEGLSDREAADRLAFGVLAAEASKQHADELTCCEIEEG